MKTKQEIQNELQETKLELESTLTEECKYDYPNFEKLDLIKKKIDTLRWVLG